MDDHITRDIRDRLQQYIYIKGEYDDYLDELTRLENNQYLPASRESDGSKKSPGASDRMVNAFIRYDEYRDSVSNDMRRIKKEMEAVEMAVSLLRDGLERRVLRLRYIIGDSSGRRQMPWRDVSMKIYGDDEDGHMQSIFSTHRKALDNIRIEDK